MASVAQAAWARVLEAGAWTGLPQWQWATVFGFLTVAVTYLVHGCAWLPLDLYHKPAWLYGHKLQQVPLDSSKLPRMWKLLMVGMVLGLTPAAFILGWGVWLGRVAVTPTLPSLTATVAHFAGFIVLEEISFYYSHRLLHSTLLYKRVHKVHHEFKQPIALAAGYAHPLEVLIGNTAPLFLHPVITGAPLSVALLWLCIATISTQTHHSGYRMPWNLGAQPDFHDFHHCPEGFRSNFGLLGWLDKLHGTDVAYQRFLNDKRA